MSTQNKATNGVAKETTKNDVLTVVSKDGQMKQESKGEGTTPSAPAVLPPAAKVLTVAELLKRNEQMNQLAKKRSALVTIHDQICAYSTTETTPGKLIFEDMHGNEFTVQNFAVISKLVDISKTTVIEEMAKIDAQIVGLF